MTDRELVDEFNSVKQNVLVALHSIKQRKNYAETYKNIEHAVSLVKTIIVRFSYDPVLTLEFKNTLTELERLKLEVIEEIKKSD